MGLRPPPAPLRRDPYTDYLNEAKHSYVHGRCSIEEFEDIIERLIFCRFPIPADPGYRVLPSAMSGPLWFWEALPSGSSR